MCRLQPGEQNAKGLGPESLLVSMQLAGIPAEQAEELLLVVEVVKNKVRLHSPHPPPPFDTNTDHELL